MVLFEMPMIHYLEKYNPIRCIAFGTILLFSGFFLLPFGRSYLYVAMTVILWTLGEMLVFPLMATFIANRAGDRNRGQFMGLFTLTFSLAFVLGPAIGSWVYSE